MVVYWYYGTFISFPKMLPSIIHLKLIICSTIDGIKSSFKDRTYNYGVENAENNKIIESCDMNWASINCILMLTIEVICTIYLFCTLMDHLSKHTLMHLFNVIVIILRFVDYLVALYYQWNEFEMLNDGIDGTIRNAKTYSINDCMYFLFVADDHIIHLQVHVLYVMIHSSNLQMNYFMEIYTFYSNIHDFHFQPIFTSIIKTFNALSRMFISCIVIVS